MIYGTYTLDLYCSRSRQGGADISYEDDVCKGLHGHDEFPHQFTDEFGSACRARARKAGWTINLKTNQAVCPKCNARSQREAR